MKQQDDQQEERQPRRVEERKQPGSTAEGAKRVDVAQPVGMLPPIEPGGLGKQPLEHLRAKPPVERNARHHQQAGTQHVEQRHDEQRADRRQRQNQEGGLAAARQHAVEHLQHIQRRNQEQQVDSQAEHPGMEEEGFESKCQVAHAACIQPYPCRTAHRPP
jgi:hypothetical protein